MLPLKNLARDEFLAQILPRPGSIATVMVLYAISCFVKPLYVKQYAEYIPQILYYLNIPIYLQCTKWQNKTKSTVLSHWSYVFLALTHRYDCKKNISAPDVSTWHSPLCPPTRSHNNNPENVLPHLVSSTNESRGIFVDRITIPHHMAWSWFRTRWRPRIVI